MFKKIRIIVLLLILATVIQNTLLSSSRTQSWKNTLYVAIYPIAADNSASTLSYVKALNQDSFKSIDAFFSRQAKQYKLQLWPPISTKLAPMLTQLPPQPPRNGNVLQVILWSLKLRWWSWQNDKIEGIKPAVRIFVLFHDPLINQNRVAHSTGLENGKIALVNAFAHPQMTGSNLVVISHELLHTLGANDRYDLSNNLPLYPHGYAEPDSKPLLPQKFAEIMGGRIPISPKRAKTPKSLNYVTIGPLTAREIGWIKAPTEANSLE